MAVIVYKRANHNNTKLDEHDVYLIKGLLQEGLSHREIAEKFEVTKSVIDKISAGDSWKHVPAYGSVDES